MLVLALTMTGTLAQATARLESDGGTILREGAFEVTLGATGVYEEWQGEASDTHAWIAMEATVLNYRHEALEIEKLISATLRYEGGYDFPGEMAFPLTTIDPLVRVTGQIVFRVPLLVAGAEPSKVTLLLEIGGENYELSPDYDAVSVAASGRDLFFETPEAAIEAFGAAVRNADFEGALSCMDANVSARGYDFSAQVTRMGGYQPNLEMPLPAAFASVNATILRGRYAFQLYSFLTSLLIGPDFVDGQRKEFDREAGALLLADGTLLPLEEMTALLDPARLSGLSLTELYRYDAEIEHGERTQENYARWGAIYGYSELKNYAAVYALDGREYVHPYMVARYADGWKIIALNSVILGMNIYGEAISREAFTEECGELVEPDFVRVK